MPYSDPVRQRQASRESARRRRARGSTGSTSLSVLPPSTGPRQAYATLALDALVAELRIVQALTDVDPLMRARTVAVVGTAMIRASEASDTARSRADG